jgi:alpha-galactosidase
MSHLISIQENGLFLALSIDPIGDVRLLHFSALPFDEASLPPEPLRHWYRLVEIHASGEDHNAHHGLKHVGTQPGARLVYTGHSDTRNSNGRKLEIVQHDPLTGLLVTSHFQFYDGLPVARAWTEVTNQGSLPVGLDYVSSFVLSGLAKEGLLPWEQKLRLRMAHNTWMGELNWANYTLPDLGLARYTDNFSMKRISISSGGTWSTAEYLPMGCLENTETGAWLFWQIEHHGAWQWEMGLLPEKLPVQDLYLNLSGPNENEHHWWKSLAPGATFVTVPAAVGATLGGLEPAMGALTQYRRRIRRPNRDDERLPVIFNDYMNCLVGDPTTAKELPLIAAAAEVGCEYFVIDAGWYDDGFWWNNVGDWLPAKGRFPGGLKEVLDEICAKGMLPGLWLELEVMGVANPRAKSLPDAWFFCRHGQRVIDHGRYQLDFRNPEVIQHANSVVDRLVGEYGAAYIKMDYNINAGVGTETAADSFGDGLLGHQRAYLAWIDAVFARYPDLVIENCSSGGMRMDYALLSRQSIQSSSDVEDYRRYARIAAASPTGVTPEQCAVWSYPLEQGDDEEVIFNMVNAILLRVHQSGHMVRISPQRRALVKEGLDVYKSIRADIPHALPFWPLGLPGMQDGWVSLGLCAGSKNYLAVWRLDSVDPTVLLPLPHLRGQPVQVACIYPHKAEGFPHRQDCAYQWQPASGILTVTLPQPYYARLFEITE